MAREQREQRRGREHRGRGRAQLARIEGQRASEHSATLTAPGSTSAPLRLRDDEQLEELLVREMSAGTPATFGRSRAASVVRELRRARPVDVAAALEELRTAASSSAVIALTSHATALDAPRRGR